MRLLEDSKKTHHVIVQGIDRRTGKTTRGSKTIGIYDCSLTIEQLADIVRENLRKVKINV
jgi:hypothetical protein